MTDTRFEITRCLSRYEFWTENQKELFHILVAQFFRGEIDSDLLYNNLKRHALIPFGTRGPTDYIGSDSALKDILKDYIIENHIPALIQFAEKQPGKKE